MCCLFLSIRDQQQHYSSYRSTVHNHARAYFSVFLSEVRLKIRKAQTFQNNIHSASHILSLTNICNVHYMFQNYKHTSICVMQSKAYSAYHYLFATSKITKGPVVSRTNNLVKQLKNTTIILQISFATSENFILSPLPSTPILLQCLLTQAYDSETIIVKHKNSVGFTSKTIGHITKRRPHLI